MLILKLITFLLVITRRAAGDVAEAVQGRAHRKLGNLQPEVWTADKSALSWKSDLHRSVPQLHIYHSEGRKMGRRKLLYLFIQRVSWRVHEGADVHHSAR